MPLVTQIASKMDALDNQNVVYISTPRLIIYEDYLVQGHTLKHDATGNLVFSSPDIQMNSHYLTQHYMCHKRKSVGVMFLAG